MGGGEGKECNITEGYHRNNTKVSKLELGTWAERLEEVVSEMGDSQSFVTLKKKAAQITQWWDLSAKFMEQCSTPLAEPVLKILKATALENPSAWGGSSALRKCCSGGFRKATDEFCMPFSKFRAVRERGTYVVLPLSGDGSRRLKGNRS